MANEHLSHGAPARRNTITARARDRDHLGLVCNSLGDRLRANAAMLECAVETRRFGVRALRSLVTDMLAQAQEADRLAEAQEWLRQGARPSSQVGRAAA